MTTGTGTSLSVVRRSAKVSRDDAIDQTGKTTAISVTMLITIAKTVPGGFGGRLAFAASVYVCPLQNDGQPSSMLDRDWGGGRSRPPPDTNFQSPVWGSSSTSGGTPRQIERCSKEIPKLDFWKVCDGLHRSQPRHIFNGDCT